MRRDSRILCWPGVVPERCVTHPSLGLESDQVHAVELVAHVAPGVARLVLDSADEQEREPAELDVGADAVFAIVEDRTQWSRMPNPDLFWRGPGWPD